MSIKSERLKKLETELQDLQQWLKLGLVPKKDIEKHKEEISVIKIKIQEEKERLKFLKENGELEEFVTPKKSTQKKAYPEVHTLPDVDIGMNQMTQSGIDMGTETFDAEVDAKDGDGEQTIIEEEEEDNPFSDRNRWKRGILEDPDVDNW